MIKKVALLNIKHKKVEPREADRIVGWLGTPLLNKSEGLKPRFTQLSLQLADANTYILIFPTKV